MTTSIASATCAQSASHGICPSASWAMLASRRGARSAECACSVVSEPPCPVFSAASKSRASGPRTSPTTMRSGRCRKACRTSSRIVIGRSPRRASRRTQLGASRASSRVSSMTTTRSRSSNLSASACSKVVLPLPVAPEISTLRRCRMAPTADAASDSLKAPFRIRSSRASRRWARRTVMQCSGATGGEAIATREPSARRTSTSGSSASAP